MPTSFAKVNTVERVIPSKHEVSSGVTSLPFSTIKIFSPLGTSKFSKINPESLNNKDELHIFIFSNKEKKQVVVTSLLDNLGKGASGQAIQNLNLMAGKGQFSL